MLADLLLHASRQSDATGGLRAHGLLPAILPIAAPVWYEATVTAERGTRMSLGYGATQSGPDVGDDDIGRELRSAAGIVVRALLLGCGQ